jgi:hypothetical protein
MSTVVTTNLKHGDASGNNIVLNSDGTFNLGSAKFETPNGSAPIYSCRAWVNFNGTTSPGTIRASGNVSSVTRNGTGDYTVNFTTAMLDANYAPTGAIGSAETLATIVLPWLITSLTTNNFRVRIGGGVSGNMGLSWSSFPNNAQLICFSVFR